MSICARRSLTGLNGHETTVRIEGLEVATEYGDEEQSDDDCDQELWRIFRGRRAELLRQASVRNIRRSSGK